MTDSRTVLVVLTGWFLFFLLWTLFILGWGQGEVKLHSAALAGLTVTVVSAVLSPLVWTLTGRVSWPGNVSLAFVFIHIIAAAFFAAAWTVAEPVLATTIDGASVSEIEWNARVFSWRLLMGIWLYVILAGISYSVRISARLRQQQEIAARAQTLAAEANLAAMRNQLQAHFLFNALHSVSSLIDTDQDKASEAMQKLGDLLRYAIKDRDSHMVELGEEWRFVGDYVDLQRLRFDDTLDVTMDDGSVDMLAPVPPFALQPLVENAFVHGIGASPVNGSIRVSARTDGDTIVLQVTDNGAGASESSISNGTGIGNLRQRLDALYGASASVTISDNDGGGTRASVVIPSIR